MQRYITFLDESAGVELTLPVTPSGYEWPHEAVIQQVTVDQMGDLNFFGGRRMGSTTLRDCILPAQAYPFLSPGAGTDPWVYLEQLERWIDGGTVVRWLVSGTPVNTAVLLEGVSYREQDGTNDLYADITLRQYQAPETPVLPVQMQADAQPVRDSATGTSTEKRHTVSAGETLWGISRAFYGDGALAWRLAAANGITNANLIRVGQVITIPPLDQLPAEPEHPASARISDATTARYDADARRWAMQLKKEEAYYE